MKTLSQPKSKSKPVESDLLSNPNTQPKKIIRNPRLKQQLEPEPTLLDLQMENEALKEQNLRCRRQVAKFKAEITQLKNDIIILTEELTNYKHDNPPFDYSESTERIKEIETRLKKLKKKKTTEQRHQADEE